MATEAFIEKRWRESSLDTIARANEICEDHRQQGYDDLRAHWPPVLDLIGD